MDCLHCGKSLPSLTRKFCNNSCSASHNNRGVVRNGKPRKKADACVGCGSSLKDYQLRFCSNKCSAGEKKRITIERFHNGLITWDKTLRSILLASSNCCSRCNLKTWLGEPIPLDVDHIDGDSRNNFPSNLRLLCKNCHGLTPTFGNRNKGRGRANRYKKEAL
jgi:predicted nucleic acid-binding Zn ribbon protein